MWGISLSSFVIGIALLAFTSSAVAQTRRMEGTHVTILDIGPRNRALNSASGTDLWADLQYSTPVDSTLHVFAEEYPAGSGCEGDVHQTNGGHTFRVTTGDWRQRFNFHWRGHGLKEGFVKVYAQLNGQEATSNICIHMNFRPGELHPLDEQ